MQDEIYNAILNKSVIGFSYDGRDRICEPHILGTANRVTQVLCYQTEGGSRRGGIPEWRRFDIAGMENLKLTGDTFDGPRPIPTGPHSIWDTIILIVS